MKYFIDTEFYEKPNTIDLISIGIVNEKDIGIYLINKEANYEEIVKDEWLLDNVIIPIYQEMVGWYRNKYYEPIPRKFDFDMFKKFVALYGSTVKEIKEQILTFTNGDEKPEFYGYYSAYDWVVFCWIFGRMIDLPDNFPMYCNDLKQLMDEMRLSKEWKDGVCPDPDGEHNALIDAKWNRLLYINIMETLSKKV
jgi:hypothetical protein